MSYHQRSLSGVTGRVYGRAIVPRGLSGVTGRVYGRAVAPRSSYVAMGGLGADAEPEVELTETEWRRQMLAHNKVVADKAREWVIQDKQIRYLQLAATLAIPLTGMFWKWFLGRRGAKVAETVTGA